jgi:8-amino-3,8-dideoxy-alpha-D-manno-octulosonate transaminase
VLQFEKEFGARMGAKYALGVTLGTAALQCALAALEVGPGDEMILPSWTWHSCFNTIVLAGALPVCAEIDESFNIDPSDIERHITPQTKAIMAVHLQRGHAFAAPRARPDKNQPPHEFRMINRQLLGDESSQRKPEHVHLS